MEKICDSCVLRHLSEACPYKGVISDDLLYGCYRFVKVSEPFNKQGKPTRCNECRFFFRKARADAEDKSFIMCGCVPSFTQKIKPVNNCRNFKPIRKSKKKARMPGKFDNRRNNGNNANWKNKS